MIELGYVASQNMNSGEYASINLAYHSHLAYEGVFAQTDGTVYMVNGNWPQLTTLANFAHAAGKKCLVSVYAGASAASLHPILASPTLLAKFVQSIVALCNPPYNMDGIDVDWEDFSPSPTVAEYRTLISAIRASLPAGKSLSAFLVPPGLLDFDWIEMSFNDLAMGSDEPTRLARYKTEVQSYLAQGWPAGELVTDFNLYALEPPGSSGVECTYASLVRQGIAVHLSSATGIATIPQIYTGVITPVPSGKLVWDGINLALAKTQYILDQHLGGVMYYDSPYDTASGSPLSLIRNVHEKLSGGVAVTVTFNGTVKESVSGANVARPVSIKVMKPEGTAETITATSTTGVFSATASYTVAGAYTVTASVAADATYNAASSPAVAFSVSATKKDLVITLTVT